MSERDTRPARLAASDRGSAMGTGCGPGVCDESSVVSYDTRAKETRDFREDFLRDVFTMIFEESLLGAQADRN